MPDGQKRSVPERITKIHKRWIGQVRWLQGFHWSLIATASISSILVAAGFGKNWLGIGAERNLLSLIAAIAIGLLSSFELGTKANDFRNAYRLLTTAVMRYEEESSYTKEQLIADYEKAEKLIGDVKASPHA